MSESEVEHLRSLIHEELKILAKRESWISKNASWMITLIIASLGGVFTFATLNASFVAHTHLPYHEGMSQTSVALAEIKTEIRFLREDVAELKKNLATH